ncbi:hypothetical protein TSMEX_010015 [Taenia solium]|eukprot:TsM_000112600 transcript=TsM_000112600 gene=TsM_000112600
MSSWLRRIVDPLIKPKKAPKLPQDEAIRLPSGMNSVSTETQSETKESEDVAEKYEKCFLAELEELAKNCRKQGYLDHLHAFNPATVTQDKREENFERLWSRARSRVDRRLAKVKHKHSSGQDGLFTDDIVSRPRHSSTSPMKSKPSGGETLTMSDMDTLNDYSWGGMECAAATNSRPINRVQKKKKKKVKKRGNVVPKCEAKAFGRVMNIT